MEPDADNTPLVVIVGPTGSGKTALAIELAKRFNGEIICADSRTVYKGMDIGTAKPTTQEQDQVVHHLLDITTPDRPISVADFKQLATQSIEKIHAKSKVPFLVGGSGLYIDAVIFNFSFREKADNTLRQELARLSIEDLQQRIFKLGLPLPMNDRNPRHLIRVIESGVSHTNEGLRPNTVVIGLDMDKEQIESRLRKRFEAMMDAGLEQEVRRLSAAYGWDCQALQTIGYQEFKQFFEGVSTLREVKELVIRHSLQYVKRQKTWFKRNKRIHYIYKVDDCVDIITTLLNKKV